MPQNKLKDVARNIATGLAFGLRNTEDLILTQKDQIDSSGGIQQNQVMEAERLSKALLKGEVTQQVKELRHRTYATANESQRYTYLGNGYAAKIDSFKNEQLPPLENSENMKIKYLQHNDVIETTITDDIAQEGYGKDASNILKIDRNFIPRFKLEKMATQLVIKEIKKGDSRVRVDIYVSMYPKQFMERYWKSFLSEMKRIKDGYSKSDILDFQSIKFTTYHAYGLLDGVEITLMNPSYVGINEYDGYYVLKYDMDIETNNIIAQFFDPVMQAKYDNHEANDVEYYLNDEASSRKSYCSNCGVEVNNYDADTVFNVIGTVLCHDCFMKRVQESEALQKEIGVVYDQKVEESNEVEESDAYKKIMTELRETLD